MKFQVVKEHTSNNIKPIEVKKEEKVRIGKKSNINDGWINLAILQSRSPTCRVNQIYDGKFSGKLIKDRGLFAKALIKNGYKVIDSEDIR